MLLLVEAQAIEEKSADRQLRAQPLDVELAPEAAHGHLKRARPSGVVECDRLAVEHQRMGAEGARELGDLRHRGGHVVQSARIDPHLLGALVHLYAGAVHLPLECRLAMQLPERLADVRGRLSEHRSDGREQLEPKPAERGRSLRERDPCDFTEILRVHRGTPNIARRQLRGGGDRIRHDPGERTLPQLPGEQPHEKPLLGGGRPREESIQRFGTASGRSGPADIDEARKLAVDLGNRQVLGGAAAAAVA